MKPDNQKDYTVTAKTEIANKIDKASKLFKSCEETPVSKEGEALCLELFEIMEIFRVNFETIVNKLLKKKNEEIYFEGEEMSDDDIRKSIGDCKKKIVQMLDSIPINSNSSEKESEKIIEEFHKIFNTIFSLEVCNDLCVSQDHIYIDEIDKTAFTYCSELYLIDLKFRSIKALNTYIKLDRKDIKKFPRSLRNRDNIRVGIPFNFFAYLQVTISMNIEKRMGLEQRKRFNNCLANFEIQELDELLEETKETLELVQKLEIHFRNKTKKSNNNKNLDKGKRFPKKKKRKKEKEKKKPLGSYPAIFQAQ